jgi:imidazoleglycerol-phosphate dehydratase
MKKREGSGSRKTRETDVKVRLALDGTGVSRLDTGIPFLNHMLELFSKHGLFDLEVKATGDLDVDIHHTNEDTGITLGQALHRALGGREKIRRYGFFTVPMDEALVSVSLDLSNRPSFYTAKNGRVKFSRLEHYSFHEATEFFKAFCMNAGINMHVHVLAGDDSHHIIEALFKAVSKALDQAVQVDERVRGVPSTKGTL